MMNTHQLQRWLMREVHGIEIPRKPPQRASHLHQGPARSWSYKAWIRSLPCAVCGIEPCHEAAHTGDHAYGEKASDYGCIPLCAQHHTLAPDSYHRLGREAFEARHALSVKELVSRLNRLWFMARRIPA